MTVTRSFFLVAAAVLTHSLIGTAFAAVSMYETPNLLTPDNNPVGVSTDIFVPTHEAIGALSIFLSINHTWVGDLVVTLTHVTTGTTCTPRLQPDCRWR